jgi:hypothetical protein
MNYNIVTTNTFDHEAKRLAKRYPSLKKDITDLYLLLEKNPHSGISLGNGLRKVRMKIGSKGIGKSGGARVITFTIIVSEFESNLNLLYIYDKSERPSIQKKEMEALLRFNGLI